LHLEALNSGLKNSGFIGFSNENPLQNHGIAAACAAKAALSGGRTCGRQQ
jgi:hypothetical protein